MAWMEVRRSDSLKDRRVFMGRGTTKKREGWKAVLGCQA